MDGEIDRMEGCDSPNKFRSDNPVHTVMPKSSVCDRQSRAGTGAPISSHVLHQEPNFLRQEQCMSHAHAQNLERKKISARCDSLFESFEH
jgi:hypothetical protein